MAFTLGIIQFSKSQPNPCLRSVVHSSSIASARSLAGRRGPTHFHAIMWKTKMIRMLPVLGLFAMLWAATSGLQLRKPGASSQIKSEIVFLRTVKIPSNESSLTDSISYSFRGFNRNFVLRVHPIEGLLSPSFHVLTVTAGALNSSLEINNGRYLRKCIYEGYVERDKTSSVTMSICHGVTGYIRVCEGDYRIEPFHASKVPEAYILYKITDSNKSLCVHFDSNEASAHEERRRSKRSISKEWNMEIMMVADSKMKRYHGKNLEMYILTLMASVALIYKEPSIGNNINISIVKLIIMSEDEDAGIIFPSASKTLRNFCRWQQELNNPEGYHHDTAILLTREDLCRHTKTCDTLGLAQSGMACDRESSCAVVEDNGLSAAFTIAHEIGHILGIPHDDDTKCGRFHKQGHRLHIMARMLDYNSYPWTWSECSRFYLTAFLDAGNGHCLLSKSKNDLLSQYEHVDKAAGELFDMDFQCELVFGHGSRICPYMPVCKRLWCTMDDYSVGGCRTQHMPWADGTRCEPEKSCLRGECILDPLYDIPAQNGEWGEWQNFGPCSRSCGGGVSRSIRECDNPRPSNGGHYCVGERMRFKSCHSQECPKGSTDFRQEQCSSFDGKTFGFPGVEANVRWVPHYAGVEPKDSCKLYCRAAGTSSYFLLKERVIDGTACGPETYDICINGKCVAAGCDHKLNSTEVTDVCGVCGGNGTSCRVISGKSTQVRYGYNNVVIIPAGASNIEVIQYGPGNKYDDNYLALMGSDHQYILNGNYQVSMFPKSIQYAGSLIDYSGSHTAYEKINATKRLDDDLYVQVLKVGSLHHPEIMYQYTVPMHEKVIYRWSLENTWSPCNSICQGEQYRKTVCIDRTDGKMVNDEYCHEQVRPQHEAKVCNSECFLRWRVDVIKPCSSTCGKGTVQNDVKCIQIMNTGEISITPMQACAHMEPRPSETEDCIGQCTTKSWKYGEWSKCSKACGSGVQHRQAICFGNDNVELPDSECNHDNKIIEQLCSSDACPNWKPDDWSECSATCGKGKRIRLIFCYHKGNFVSRTLCNESEVPPHNEPCPELPPCSEWEAGPWELCSASCGTAVRRRRVVCTENNHVVPLEKCEGIFKPIDIESCHLPLCLIKFDNYPRIFENMIPAPLPDEEVKDSLTSTGDSQSAVWRTGNWSSCSATCGEGLMYRQVICQHPSSQRVLPDRKCSRHQRPNHIKTCRLPTCGRWGTGEWSECSTSCGSGVQTRHIMCVLPDERRSEDDLCDLNTKPKTEKHCSLAVCPIQNPTADEEENSVGAEIGSTPYWRTGLWGKCSKPCGGGIRRRQVACYDVRGKLSQSCDPREKPPDTSQCNLERCPYWRIGEWDSCSVTCGKGTQSRAVQCIDDKRNPLLKDRCSVPAPEDVRSCKLDECLHWVWAAWSPCSKTCGTGLQTRTVECRKGRKLAHPTACSDIPKPTSEIKACKRFKCEGYYWKKQKWSMCSAICGRGHKTREVSCMKEQTTLEAHFCSHLRRPKERRRCNIYNCSMTWMTSPWSDCSQTCGRGFQSRNTTCHQVNAYKWINPEPLTPPMGSERWCKVDDRPAIRRECNLGSCSDNTWVVGAWSECSSKCGIGRQRRRVHCHNPLGKRIRNRECDGNHRPQRKRRCHERPCAAISCWDFKLRGNIRVDGEQEIFVRGRYVKIYCAKMNTSYPQEYITLVRGEQDNYSEVYGKRLNNPDTCPYGGARFDGCACMNLTAKETGVTTFKRIAINITSLEVLRDDWVFSQTHGEQPIAFAEAADCYSNATCPQARFSLSLLGTGFIVSPQTKWIAHGNNPSSRIRWLEGGQVIQGKCGGYCGRCAPDDKSGLLLEVAPP